MHTQSVTDQALLSAVPGYLSISNLLKATPMTEGTDRFIYLEASNESLDQHNEVVLSKALQESSDFYLKFGNLDLEHLTQIGAKQGIPNYELYEIGRPVDITSRNGVTFVKGQIYSGNGPAAEKANSFWSSLTDLNPPARWYPSVGGSVLEKSIVIDPETNAKKAMITKVRWTNIGFSKTPVNANLSTVSTVPFGALAKSWGSDGLDLVKALTAGYGSDSASLEGGAALRTQSLYGSDYKAMCDKFSPIFQNLWKAGGLTFSTLNKAARESFGFSDNDAQQFVERFLSDISNNIRG